MRTRSQDFDIVSTLGKGTYGACYRVRRKEDGELLVIKVVSLEGLSTKDRNETLNEARLMQKLQHKNVVRYCESWCEAECLYIVMQYYGGGDLGRLIKRHRGHVPEQEVWKHLIDIAQGLAYIHERRILHRDIKASNVFLNGDLAVIGDLGLGRVLGPNTAMAYSQVGTPLYFSPELCEEQPYDYKSDVWSFGCLIYELAAGLPPFIASNQLALARKIVSDPPPSLPRMYSRELQSLIHVMLEKKPATRPSMLDILSHPSVSARIQIYEMKNEYRTLEEGLIKEYQKKKVELEGQFNSWKKEISSEFQARLGAAKSSGEKSSSRKEKELLMQRAREAEQMARKANEERSSLQRKLFACESELRGLQATMAKAESESGRRSKELQDTKHKLHDEEKTNTSLRKQLKAEKEMSTRLGMRMKVMEERHSEDLVSSGCQTDAMVCANETHDVDGGAVPPQEDASLFWLTPPYQSPASPSLPETSDPIKHMHTAPQHPSEHTTSPTFVAGAGQCAPQCKELPGGIPVTPWQGASGFQNPFADEGSDQTQEKEKHTSALADGVPTCDTPTISQIRKMVAQDIPTSIRSAPTTPYRQMTEEILARQTATPQAPTGRYMELPQHQPTHQTDAHGWQSALRGRHHLEQHIPKASHPELSNGWSSLRDTDRETGSRCVEDRFRHPASAKPDVSRREDRPLKKARSSEVMKSMQADHRDSRSRSCSEELELGAMDAANSGKSTPLTCLLHWKKGLHKAAQPKSKQFVHQPSWGNKERYSVPAGGGSNLGLLFKTRKSSKEIPMVKKMWARLRATTRFEKMDLHRQRKLQARSGGSYWFLTQAVWGAAVGGNRDVAEIMIEFTSPHVLEELLVVKHNDALHTITKGAAQTSRVKVGPPSFTPELEQDGHHRMGLGIRESFALRYNADAITRNASSKPEQARPAELTGSHKTSSSVAMSLHPSKRQQTGSGVNSSGHSGHGSGKASERIVKGCAQEVHLYTDLETAPVTESLSWPLRPDQVEQIQRQVGNNAEAKQELTSQQSWNGDTHHKALDGSDRDIGAPEAEMGMLMENLSRTLASVEHNLQSKPAPSRADDWNEIHQGKENQKLDHGAARLHRQMASPSITRCENSFTAPKYHINKPTRFSALRNLEEELPSTPYADRFMDGVATPFSTPYRDAEMDPICGVGTGRRPIDAEALQQQAQQLQHQLRVACEMLSSPLKPDERGQHTP